MGQKIGVGDCILLPYRTHSFFVKNIFLVKICYNMSTAKKCFPGEQRRSWPPLNKSSIGR